MVFSSAILLSMTKRSSLKRSSASATLPLLIELDEDGFYIVECPVLPGCYTQGKTLDEALHNIQEVIALLQDEKGTRTMLREYRPKAISFHTITV